MNADYWIRNMVGCVHFDAACIAAYEFGARICLDIGPQPILSALFVSNVESIPNAEKILCTPSLRKNADDVTTLFTSLGSMYSAGVSVDWTEFHNKWAGEKMSIPTYPFQRKSYWFPQGKKIRFGLNQASLIHPLLGHIFPSASAETIFQSHILVKDKPFLEEHKIGENVIFPGAGFIEMCLAGGQYAVAGQKTDSQTFGLATLTNFKIHSPLRVDLEQGCELQTLVGALDENGLSEISIYRKV
jgi:acyl transferase domain-containing protein